MKSSRNINKFRSQNENKLGEINDGNALPERSRRVLIVKNDLNKIVDDERRKDFTKIFKAFVKTKSICIIKKNIKTRYRRSNNSFIRIEWKRFLARREKLEKIKRKYFFTKQMDYERKNKMIPMIRNAR